MNPSRMSAGSRRLTAIALACTATVAFVTSDAYAQRTRAPQTFNVVPITVASVTPQDGQLMANLLVGSHLVPVPLTMSVPQDQQQALQQGACPVLNLSLGPIDLNLLGLGVGTSPICLRVTAIEGGGLLGDLLCSIAGLLNQGQSITQVLEGLTTDQLNTLNYGLTQTLNQAVFIPLTSSEAASSATCSILHLELGPLDLNLLGLRVELDDCSAGPVVLDVTADPAGGLLGDLLCGLSNLLNNNSPNQTPPVLNLLRDVAAAIGRIWG